MGFIPLQGPATLHPAELPRESEVEFSGPRRNIRMPIRGAIPVLSKVLRGQEVHDSVALLGAATLLGMKLVTAGTVQWRGDAWRVGPLTETDEQRIRDLAVARSYEGADAAGAEAIIRALCDAVADTLTRQPANPPRARLPRQRVADGDVVGHGDGSVVAEVTLALRVDAPEESLRAGRLTLVPQAHAATDPMTFAAAEDVWAGEAVGFGRQARRSLISVLRHAGRLWSPAQRLVAAGGPAPVVLSSDEIESLLEDGLTRLATAGIDVLWPRALRAELTPHASVEVRPTRDVDGRAGRVRFDAEALFTFDWRVALAGDPLTDEEMTDLTEAAGPVIRLRDNWVVVDPATIRRVRSRRARRVLSPAEGLEAALTGVVRVDDCPVPVHPGTRLSQLRDRVVDAVVVAPLPSPAGLHAALRDYQRRGLTWLAELTGAGLGACLADDMGLGKTITVIALHLHRWERGLTHGPTLVVCPTSLMGNWEHEIRRFAPGLPVRRFHGDQRDLTGLPLRDGTAPPGGGGSDDKPTLGPGFVLTTYGMVRRRHEELTTVEWDLLVADEAQHVKNPRSVAARHLRTIRSSARVALTGTPVENNLDDLWAILDWAVPGLLGSRNAFRARWAVPIESGVDPEITRRFADLIGPFLLRRRKSDPGIAPELPAKTETDRLVGLTREQAVLYQTLVEESMARIETADPEARRGLVLALLTGLKQICNHPAQYLHQPGGRLLGRSEKFTVLDELLATILAEDGKVLLFTQYVATARLLERLLSERSVGTQFLHGGTPVAQRDALVERFQRGEVPVFLLSLRAGGTGLNLTRADHVIHFDRWWNPAVEDQATDRAYRIGQTRPVQVHRLVTEGTVEERVAELLERKRTLAEAVLGSDETAFSELSDAELRDLVTLRRG